MSICRRTFKDACAGLSAKNEMRLVFSIVNTITAIDGINKVQFLVEGQQTMELCRHAVPRRPVP